MHEGERERKKTTLVVMEIERGSEGKKRKG